MSDNKLPDSIGKYRIDGVLGKGAMGLVYRAFDTDIDRTVALKTLHTHLLDGEQGSDFSLRFMQEAKAAARCLHPNIVTVFDFGIHDTTPYIVMEFVDGVELKDQLRGDKAISFELSLDIISQILEALAYAHDSGVVHRDIKPANIMLMNNGRVKVSDFGVARIDSSDLTGTGMMVGTPNYMSPEGMHGLQVDNRSDLYSIGILLFELLTKKRPYIGMSIDEAIAPLDESEHLKAFQKAQIKPIILRALQPKPERRYQNATEFLNQIKNVISESDADQATVFHRPAKVTTQDAANPQTNSGLLGVSTADADQSLHPDVLATLESSLIHYVGPAAKALIKRYSKKSYTLEGLSQNLAQQIPNKDERTEFLHSLETSGIREISLIKEAETQSGLTVAGGTGTILNTCGPQTLSPQTLQTLTNELAFYIGPLASRVVNKAYRQLTGTEEFYTKLASYIPDVTERDEFLKKVK